MNLINTQDIEIFKSKYGNEYCQITFEDILSLLQGKIIYVNVAGEYSLFIGLGDWRTTNNAEN